MFKLSFLNNNTGETRLAVGFHSSKESLVFLAESLYLYDPSYSDWSFCIEEPRSEVPESDVHHAMSVGTTFYNVNHCHHESWGDEALMSLLVWAYSQQLTV